MSPRCGAGPQLRRENLTASHTHTTSLPHTYTTSLPHCLTHTTSLPHTHNLTASHTQPHCLTPPHCLTHTTSHILTRITVMKKQEEVFTGQGGDEVSLQHWLEEAVHLTVLVVTHARDEVLHKVHLLRRIPPVKVDDALVTLRQVAGRRLHFRRGRLELSDTARHHRGNLDLIDGWTVGPGPGQQRR